MATGKKNNQKSPDITWLFLGLFIFGVFLLLSTEKREEKSLNTTLSAPTASFDEQEKLKRVNQHLQETALQVEQDRVKRAQETSRELERLKNSQPQESFVQNEGTQFSFESTAAMDQLTEELNRSHVLPEDQLTPEQIVNNRLLEMQREQRADKEYREEYARRFIENARAGGWEIKLGPNFEVLSVKKIRARRPSLFDSEPNE